MNDKELTKVKELIRGIKKEVYSCENLAVELNSILNPFGIPGKPGVYTADPIVMDLISILSTVLNTKYVLNAITALLKKHPEIINKL